MSPATWPTRPEFAALAATIQTGHGRLDGVFHAAGQLDLQRLALVSKTRESIDAVWRAKVAGSVQLVEQLVRPLGVQQLVLFSSIGCLSSPLGAGESDYAAGCRYQTHLAAWLRTRRAASAGRAAFGMGRRRDAGRRAGGPDRGAA